MSYCRWSTESPRSDIYCYESDVGYEVHVTRCRRVLPLDLPPPVPFDGDHIAEWVARREVVAQMLDAAPLVPIGLPHDGESWCVRMPGEAADLLARLRDIGYDVPDSAIEALREEAADLGT